MTTWTSDELNKIGRAEELEIAPRRRDGTLRKPVTIWVVRLGDNLYVRCANGRTGAWFRGAQVRHEGRIQAGGVEKDVTFVEEVDPDINDKIDAAYLTKYRRYPQYVAPHGDPGSAGCNDQTGATLDRLVISFEGENYGIRSIRIDRYEGLAHLPGLHGVRGRRTLGSQMGAQRRK